MKTQQIVQIHLLFMFFPPHLGNSGEKFKETLVNIVDDGPSLRVFMKNSNNNPGNYCKSISLKTAQQM